MNADLKNSETMKNLMRAFAGESQARNRYTFAAGTAKKEGLPVVEAVFKFTADQEKEHAEVFYKLLKELTGASIRVDGSYPVDTHEKTIDLLRAANHNEMEESVESINKVAHDGEGGFTRKLRSILLSDR